MSELKKAVIYARYSCDKQTEQSIEGQMRVCNEFAEREGYTIVGSYIDRAKSAKTDDRPEFLKMISDSSKGHFQFVIVYKLDRFSRNRYHSAVYKAKLRKNGVKVISATEPLSEGPEGIITEAVLEAMAEFYSAELGQKTKRGMRESALKCQTTGALPPLGYKWGDDKKLHIDEATADIPRIAFKMYAEGEGKQAIADELNRRGFRTRTGKLFKINNFDSMLVNKKYAGVFTYGEDVAIEGGCPALIDRETFEKVQSLVSYTKKAPARAKAKVEYYLAGKLFCGVCGEKMIATGGTARNGDQRHYYRCKNKIAHTCPKKSELKSFIEWYVTSEVIDLIGGGHREILADKIIYAYKKSMETSEVDNYRRKIEGLKAKQNAVLDMILEKGKLPSLMEKFDNLELQISEYTEALNSAELAARHIPTRAEILEWFDLLGKADPISESARRQICNTFIQKIFLWDDKAVIVFSLANTEETVSFEEICDFEKLVDDDKINKPLSDEAENGSFNSGIGSPFVPLNHICVVNGLLCLFLYSREKV